MSKLMSAVVAPLGHYAVSCAKDMLAPSTWLTVLQGTAPGIVLGMLLSPFMVAWCLTHPPGSISAEQIDAVFAVAMKLVAALIVLVCMVGAMIGPLALYLDWRRGPK